jgi:membrane fusion protein (multidrug efflux system)
MAMNESDRAPVSPEDRSPSRVAANGRGKLWAVGVVALLLAAWGGYWLYQRWLHVYIDDARIDGEVITISSRVSGWITELPVIEGDEVKKGQLLAQVDDRDSRLQREVLVAKLNALENQATVVQAQSGQVDQETLGKYQSEISRLAAAQAEVASFDVQLQQARDDYRRARDLAEAKWLSPQAMERARSTTANRGPKLPRRAAHFRLPAAAVARSRSWSASCSCSPARLTRCAPR